MPAKPNIVVTSGSPSGRIDGDTAITYPEPRYLGDNGEVSALYRPTNHEPEVTYANGNTAHYLATGASTDGLFGLYRWVMGPEPSGPGPHFHRTITESFYILTGTVRIYDGARWIETQPGDFVHVPDRRDPRVPQRVRRTGDDAPALCTRALPAKAISRASPSSPDRASRATRSWPTSTGCHDNTWL